MADLNNNMGMPRWVKVFGIIAIIVVVLFIVLLLSGRGHGPGRHMNGAVTTVQQP